MQKQSPLEHFLRSSTNYTAFVQLSHHQYTSILSLLDDHIFIYPLYRYHDFDHDDCDGAGRGA